MSVFFSFFMCRPTCLTVAKSSVPMGREVGSVGRVDFSAAAAAAAAAADPLFATPPRLCCKLERSPKRTSCAARFGVRARVFCLKAKGGREEGKICFRQTGETESARISGASFFFVVRVFLPRLAANVVIQLSEETSHDVSGLCCELACVKCNRCVLVAELTRR